jgi:hypothetical protein
MGASVPLGGLASRSCLFGWLTALVTVSLGMIALGAQATEVVIVAGSRTFHLKGCAQVAGNAESHVRSVARSSLDATYTACEVCRPDARAPAPKAAVSTADLEEFWSRYDPAETVAIVTGTQTTGLYHRRGCWWLTAGLTQLFTRKDADGRYFQPHHECLRKAPDSNSRSSSASAPAAAAPVSARPLVDVEGARSAASPRTPGPTLRDTERQQCAATTRKGTRCSRMAQAGRAYCWQHP